MWSPNSDVANGLRSDAGDVERQRCPEEQTIGRIGEAVPAKQRRAKRCANEIYAELLAGTDASCAVDRPPSIRPGSRSAGIARMVRHRDNARRSIPRGRRRVRVRGGTRWCRRRRTSCCQTYHVGLVRQPARSVDDAMNVFTICLARSVSGPSSATQSYAAPSNNSTDSAASLSNSRQTSAGTPAARCRRTGPAIVNIGTMVMGSWRSRISCGLLSWMVSGD